MGNFSLKFTNIENNLVKLYTLLSESQNIKKLIYYLDSDDPLLEADVNIDLKDNGNFLLSFFDNKTETEEKVKIYLNIYDGNLRGNAIGIINYTLDIIVPTSKWILPNTGKLRPYRICDEFAKLVDGQWIAGLGKTMITNFKSYKLNDTLSGVTLFIKTNSSTLKGGF